MQHAVIDPVRSGAAPGTARTPPVLSPGAAGTPPALAPAALLDGDGEQTDAELIAATRAGHLDAFGELYARHVPAARRLAHGLTRNAADVDDLIAEAFTKVLATLRAGRGPDLAFRAYLLTAVRNAFHDRVRRDRRISLTDDLTPYDPGEPFIDTTIAELDRACAARAFAKLPERWRAVLWYTEVEGASPTTVAPLLGLTPNGVAALAYRARERLRQVYLQEHVSEAGDPRCHWTTDRLGGYVRGTLSPRDRLKVDRHLGRCGACRLLRGELGDINSSLHAVTPATLLFWIVSSQPPTLAWLLAPLGIAVGRGLVDVIVRCVRRRSSWPGTLGPWPVVVTTAPQAQRQAQRQARRGARWPAGGPTLPPG